MKQKVEIDFKMFKELTDDDIEWIDINLNNAKENVFDYEVYDVPYEHMEERLRIFNYTTPVLKNKKVLNNVMKEFNRLYELYELKKMSDEELTLSQSIADDGREFQLNLRYLLSGIYVMCYSFCDDIFEQVTSKMKICADPDSNVEGIYVNGEKIGVTFVHDVQKLSDNALDVCRYFTSNFS